MLIDFFSIDESFLLIFCSCIEILVFFIMLQHVFIKCSWIFLVLFSLFICFTSLFHVWKFFCYYFSKQIFLCPLCGLDFSLILVILILDFESSSCNQIHFSCSLVVFKALPMNCELSTAQPSRSYTLSTPWPLLLPIHAMVCLIFWISDQHFFYRLFIIFYTRYSRFSCFTLTALNFYLCPLWTC